MLKLEQPVRELGNSVSWGSWAVAKPPGDIWRTEMSAVRPEINWQKRRIWQRSSIFSHKSLLTTINSSKTEEILSTCSSDCFPFLVFTFPSLKDQLQCVCDQSLKDCLLTASDRAENVSQMLVPGHQKKVCQ